MSSKSKNEEQISLIIADDHPVFRQGLAQILKKSPIVGEIAQAANGLEVLQLLENNYFKLVLMDLKMPKLDGMKATELIRQKYPKTDVIALSMLDDHPSISSVIKLGAKGYILKNADQEIIFEAIKAVSENKTYYSTEVSTILLDNLLKSDPSEKEVDLKNPLIRDIIFLLCHELNNQQIADLLFKSPRTIEFHRNKIIKNTHSKNIIGVLRFAIDHKLLEDESLILKWKNKLNLK